MKYRYVPEEPDRQATGDFPQAHTTGQARPPQRRYQPTDPRCGAWLFVPDVYPSDAHRRVGVAYYVSGEDLREEV